MLLDTTRRLSKSKLFGYYKDSQVYHLITKLFNNHLKIRKNDSISNHLSEIDSNLSIRCFLKIHIIK